MYFYKPITKFKHTMDVVKYINENNIEEKSLDIECFSGRSGIDILILRYSPNICDIEPDWEDLLELGYQNPYNLYFIKLPDELLECLSYGSISEYMKITGVNHTISNKFKETKKYLQAELEYIL